MKESQKIARSIIFPTITALGLERFLSLGSVNNCLIIMYHGVIDDQVPRINGRHMKRSVFVRHLDYFKRNFDVVSLGQIFSYYRNGIRPNRRSIAITFDDGYYNNYSIAAPLLKEYCIPATFFIQGMSMDDPEYITWPDAIDILYSSNIKSISLEGVEYKSDSKRKGYYNAGGELALVDSVKKLDPVKRNEFFQTLEINFKYMDLLRLVDNDIWKLMSNIEVRHLSQDSLFEIGSHSYSHSCLANINELYIEEELGKSKSVLEEICQKDILSLAYPDGSYNNIVKKKSLEIGYRNLCAVDYMLDDDPNDFSILQRHGLSATTTASSNIVFLRRSFNSHGF